MGPNTLSGHLSVLYTTECQINFVLRVIRPILNAMNRSLLSFLPGSQGPESVAVTSTAERKDVAKIDEKAKQLVWATGCTSWFIDSSTGRNTIMFPDWQFKFHLRSIFIPWGDFVYKTAPKQISREVKLGLFAPYSFSAAKIIAVGALLGISLSTGFDLPSKLSPLQQYLGSIYSLPGGK